MPRPQYARQRKYRNVPTVVDGVKFDSKAEAKRWGELKLLERAGAIGHLARQVPFRLEVQGQLICKYLADFLYVEEPSGDIVVEDVKSPASKTRVYSLKRKLMKACHGIEIRETT